MAIGSERKNKMTENKMATLLVHDIVTGSLVNGPGKRVVLWTQGCTLKCPGCWNEHTHSLTKGRRFPITELAAHMINLCGSDHNGITISGGEPMQQALGLVELLRTLRRELPNVDIGMYTGYKLEQLERSSKVWAEAKQLLDWAVVGRYERENPASPDTPLVTSANQKLVLFGTRVSLGDFKRKAVQIDIAAESPDLVTITGFPVR